MTIMEARPANTLALNSEVTDYLGQTLDSKGLSLYTDDANDLAKRVTVASVGDDSIGVIDLDNPAFKDVRDDVPSAVRRGLDDSRYLVANLSLESIAEEVQDMIDDGFLEDADQVEQDFQRGLDKVETPTVLRAILRAVQDNRIFRREYLTDDQTIRSVNSDDWDADPSAIRNVTCMECFTIRSSAGACACAE